jgi:hypothetical protein
MARRNTVIDEEKRSYGALWLICSILLFVGGLGASTQHPLASSLMAAT